MSVKDYFEHLASEHTLVRHRAEAEPHFACSLDDAATLMARRLYYPAVFLYEGDLAVTGSIGNELLQRDYTLVSATHVLDSGDESQKREALEVTETVMTDILARMVRDKRIGEKAVSRFSPLGCEAHRVELAEAGLYGWLLFFNLTTSLSTLNCNAHFES